MSVSKSPFRASVSQTAPTSASKSSGSGSSMSLDDLAEVLSNTFLENQRLLELRNFIKNTTPADALPVANFKKLIAFAVKHLEQGSLPEETRAKIYTDPSILSYFTFALHVFESACAEHTKESTFASDLIKLGIKQEYVTEMANAYKQRREFMTANVQKQRVALPTITNVRWRVDVTISTTSLSRVFKPTIPLQLTLSDGTIRNFECSVEKFHELRYSVAKAHKHQLDLLTHPTLTRELE